MSLFGKYLAINNNTINKSSSSSSTTSSVKSSASSTSSLKTKMNHYKLNNNYQNKTLDYQSKLNSTNPCIDKQNKSTSDKFEFKPITLTSTSTPFFNANKIKNISTGFRKSDKSVNNLLHNTSKSGKITKRKAVAKKMNNSGLIQCYNLAEKERFRKLISSNLVLINKNQNSEDNISLTDDNNAYKNLIHHSPTKVQDDTVYSKVKTKFDQTLIEKYSISNILNFNPGKLISTGYTRRISLDISNQYHSKLLPNKIDSKNNKEPTIIELDLTQDDSDSNINNKKSAQKRPTTQPVNFDENDELASFNNESFKTELKSLNLPSYQNISKVNRKLTEYEKKLNDRINKNSSILEIILKKTQTKPSALTIEEERYKLKKIQRLERDKIEKELANKFSQQLHLDANRISGLYLEEEEKVEIEDEFPELTFEQENLIKNALMPSPHDEILVNGFGAGITRKDIQTLKGLNWLNDEIINFYMNLICERSQTNSLFNKVYAFSTFFYPKLIKDGYNSLKRWTRKVDIFSHDLILIPVHLGLHWTLSIIDFTCKEIRYYDSMNGNNNECLKALRNYLKDEYSDKKQGAQFDLTNWNCIHVKDIPQQMNGSDCGMFTCKYAEFLSRGKTVFNFNQSHMPYFRRRMVWEIINKKLL